MYVNVSPEIVRKNSISGIIYWNGDFRNSQLVSSNHSACCSTLPCFFRPVNAPDVFPVHSRPANFSEISACLSPWSLDMLVVQPLSEWLSFPRIQNLD